MLEIRDVGKTYGSGEKATRGAPSRHLHGRRGRVRLCRRPVRLRQDDSHQVHCGSACGRRTGRSSSNGNSITAPPEEMAVVFQEYNRSLMPWMSVRNNVLLPLRHKRLAKEERIEARRGVALRRSA